MPLDTPDFEAELERAIATYANPGDRGHPLALTARVMAEIEARGRRRRWWLGIAVAVPVLGCLIVAALLYNGRPKTRHQAAGNAFVAPIPGPVIVPKASSPPKLEIVRHQTTHNQPRQLPKLDQFPTPSPMTEQERLLVQFMAHAPQKTQQSIAKTQKQANEPLDIAKLAIPALDSRIQPQ